MNNEKKDSQFGKGMQPVVYSMKEAIQGNPAWRRSGKNIVYTKNCYKNRIGMLLRNIDYIITMT